MTLANVVETIRQHGLDVLIADAAVTSAHGDVTAAKAIPNPSLNGTIGLYSFDCGFQHCAAGFGVTVGDSAAIENFISGKRALKGRVAERALIAAKASRDDAVRTVVSLGKQAFIAALESQRALEFATDAQKNAQHLLDLTQIRYKSGAIDEADLARIETAELETAQAVDHARADVTQAYAQLAFLLGFRGNVPAFTVSEESFTGYALPPKLENASAQAFIDSAQTSRPDLRAARAQRESADSAVTLNKRLRVPDFTLGANYQQQGHGINNFTPPTISLVVGTTLPVFNQRNGEIEHAIADQRTAALQVEKLEAQVVGDVVGAFADFDASRITLQRMEQQLIARAKRARDLVQIQYDKGAASLLELIDAQRTYLAVNREYLDDLTTYWTAVFQLEAATGMDLL